MNDNGWWIPIAVLSGMILIVGLFLWVSFHFDKKRRLEWLEVATALGFENLSVYPNELDEIVGSSRLMTTGRQRAWTNVFRRQVESLSVTFCDYRYTVGHGKHKTTWQQTVILFCSPALDAPRFEIKPEGWFNKLGAMLGAQDIDFPESPEFSKKYVLTGDNEEAIRKFLRPDILQLLAEFQNLCLEIRPGSLMLWFDRRRISPTEFNAVFEQAFSVCSAMSQPA